MRGITRNVVIIGWVSFFTDLASEMLYPILPLFVVGTLGAPSSVLGLIEGLAEGISSGLRWIGGHLSDRLGRRKPLVVAGYTVSAFSKPVMGLAAFAIGWPLFLVGRCADRLGKSIRTAARDALIADFTEPQYRGRAFGLHRAMDTAGAVVGPLVALLIIWLWPQFSLAWLFIIALAPGIISALLAGVGVQDRRPIAPDPNAKQAATPRPARAPLPRPFWILLAAFGLFSLGNSSDAFLLLRAKEIGLPTAHIVLAYAIYNAVYAAAATPLGHLSDALGRRPVLAAGWIVYAGVYLGFAATGSAAAPWFLLAIYGLYQALTEGISKALVTDLVPGDQRATAIGLLATVAGLGQLAASLLAGFLWPVRILDGRLMLPFVIGAACALAAVPVLWSVRPHGRAAA